MAMIRQRKASTQHDKYKQPPVTMTLWSHEQKPGVEDVMVDMSLLPLAEPGDIAELRTLDSRHKIRFVVKAIDQLPAGRPDKSQVSVVAPILGAMDIAPRSKVQVRLVSKRDVHLDMVEIYFKDTYLTRADMWRISASLIGRCLYTNQRISYCEIVRATSKSMYRRGKKTFSGYVGPDTKIVYRSEAARMIYFIQMSSEMWNFVENGELVFDKLVNSFLPEVFRRWREQGSHHLVSIVLFTSVDVSGKMSRSHQGEREKKTRDYFHIVIDQVHINKWSEIMSKLRYEFARFMREVLLQPETGEIQGRILPAVKGNMLEAISFATSLVSSKFLDRDLRRSGIQVILVTPGTGIYDVDYDLLYQTSIKLLSIEIGIDIICLSRPPLHVTPLFRYKDIRTGNVVNCVPSWLDISFWNSQDVSSARQWIPRCKIYDIQMMGIMENETNAIRVDYLNGPNSSHREEIDKYMKEYDENVFLSKSAIASQRLIEEATSSTSAPALLRPRVSVPEITGHTTTASAVADIAPKSTSISAVPTSAIISTPRGTTTSSTLLTNAIKTRPRISALTSLLSLGRPTTTNRKVSGSSMTRLASVGSQTSERTTTASDTASLDERQSISSTGPNSNQKVAEEPTVKSSPRIVSKATTNDNAPPARPSTGSWQSSDIVKPKSLGKMNDQSGSNDSTITSTSPRLIRTSDVLLSQSKRDNGNYIWFEIPNPSNVNSRAVMNISNYGRWRNVFPPGVKRKSVKWRSLKSPAALPLSTEIFPTPEDFSKNYTFQIYDVALDPEKEDHMSPGDLIEEMIALRLHIGFQVAVGSRVNLVEAQRREGNSTLIVPTIPEDPRGMRMYLTRTNQIHRLAVDQYGTINVQLYTRSDSAYGHVKEEYHPLVKTRFETSYHLAPGNFFDPSVRLVNWNRLDQQLAGYSDFFQQSDKLFRVRFVLIPMEVQSGKTSLFTGADGGGGDTGTDRLNVEEIRLEGLRKIMATLYKGRYLTPQERKLRNSRKEINTPDIKFYTGDLGTYLLQLYEDYTLQSQTIDRRKGTFLIRESERLNKSIRLRSLAQELQSEQGIEIMDRRWHWKIHDNCFVGHELVNWLIENFTDIDTAEEAVEYGNQLKELGLFQHVDDRHSFMNGHYYYRIKPEYVSEHTESSSATHKQDRDTLRESDAPGSSAQSRSNNTSISGVAPSSNDPSTNLDDGNILNRALKNSAMSYGNISSGPSGHLTSAAPSLTSTAGSTTGDGHAAANSSSNVNSRAGPSIHSQLGAVVGSRAGSITPADNDGRSSIQDRASSILSDRSRKDSMKPLPRIFVSQEITYDIDPNKRSKRHEFLTVHVDRVHNPENAYHLRVEWLNATPRLIEESLLNIGRIGERHNLKLVQLPIEEISTLPNDSPFCCLKRAKFSLDPTEFHKSHTKSAVSFDDPQFYHKKFLQKQGFIIDTVPSSSLMSNEVEIQYSWGKPFYNYGQYIHMSGNIIAQIVGDMSFVFMVNALNVSKIGFTSGVASQYLVPDADQLLKTLTECIENEEYLFDIFSQIMSDENESLNFSDGEN